ncbi:MAG: EamA family transporter [Candidatus Omnitrophica bacterium]|nr:EamA family transporter [Candidatus Omnitrophota bacterium]
MSGYFWALLTACIWGLVPVLEKTGLSQIKPFQGLFFRSLGIVLGLALLGLFIVKPAEIRAVPVRSALILVLSGFMASFLAQIAFYHALKVGEVSRVVPVAGSFPMIAFLLGVVFLGETFTLVKAAGMALVIGGIWLLKLG